MSNWKKNFFLIETIEKSQKHIPNIKDIFLVLYYHKIHLAIVFYDVQNNLKMMSCFDDAFTTRSFSAMLSLVASYFQLQSQLGKACACSLFFIMAINFKKTVLIVQGIVCMCFCYRRMFGLPLEVINRYWYFGLSSNPGSCLSGY